MHKNIVIVRNDNQDHHFFIADHLILRFRNKTFAARNVYNKLFNFIRDFVWILNLIVINCIALLRTNIKNTVAQNDKI